MTAEPPLGEVPRTALWTLYCRAHHAAKGRLEDPEAIRWADALVPNGAEIFGPAPSSFAVRARLFDERVTRALDEGVTQVVSLGEGLETQRHRVPGPRLWWSVDLPEMIEVRERLVSPDSTHRHLAQDAVEGDWLDEIEAGPSIVLAQGLFMYVEPSRLRRLVRRVMARPQTSLLFDVVPPWVARLSRLRPPMGAAFHIPPMPWGIRAQRLPTTLQAWSERPVWLETQPLPLPRGPLPWKPHTVLVHAF
ncbi:MAG: class I SAM-dependent methyltransferase [Myxococcota bacterium]